MANLTKSLDSLFISKVRIKALKYFLFNRESIHLRGAVRKLNEEINAVRRELTRLEEIGLLKSDKQGNRKYFSLNETHPLLNELMGVFHKSFGLGGEIVKNQDKLGEINYALLTSYYYKRKHPKGQSVVELVMIGDVKLDKLQSIVHEAEQKLGREINYTVMKPSEFTLRKKRRDPFVFELLMDDGIVLLGDLDKLPD